MNSNKYLEYYLDSKIYTYEEIKENIEKIKKEFPNKNVETNITLNNFRVYIVTFKFQNKDTYFRKIKNQLSIYEEIKNNANNKKQIQKNKKDKVKSRFEKYSNYTYGKYKPTKIYHPY